METFSVTSPMLIEQGERKIERLKRVCSDFESLFIYQLMKNMENTIPKSGVLRDMSGKDTYRLIMDEKVAEAIAHRGGIGLAMILFSQLGKVVEKR